MIGKDDAKRHRAHGLGHVDVARRLGIGLCLGLVILVFVVIVRWVCKRAVVCIDQVEIHGDGPAGCQLLHDGIERVRKRDLAVLGHAILGHGKRDGRHAATNCRGISVLAVVGEERPLAFSEACRKRDVVVIGIG